MATTFDEATTTWPVVTPSAGGTPVVTQAPFPWLIRAGGSWTRDGLLIDHITPGGPASRTTDRTDHLRHRLESGDVITSVDEVAVLSSDDWTRALMTASDVSRIRLSVVRRDAPYDWFIAPQWRASAAFPEPQIPASSRALSKIAQAALEETGAEHRLARDRVRAIIESMETTAKATREMVATMNDEERRQFRDSVPRAEGDALKSRGLKRLRLSRVDLTVPPGLQRSKGSAGAVISPAPAGLKPAAALGWDFDWDPSSWFPAISDTVVDVWHRTVDGLKTWSEGVGSAIVETIGQFVIGMVKGVAEAFGTFCAHLDVMFMHLRSITQEGKWNGFGKAMLSLCHAVGALLVGVPEAVGVAVVDCVVDIVFGVIPAYAGARSLTQDEKDFVHSIFHGDINLSHVRIVATPLPGDYNLVAANVVWCEPLEVASMTSRANFAATFTPVYQDQDPSSRGTQGIARDILRGTPLTGWNKTFSLTPGMRWDDLTLIQQIEFIKLWQLHWDNFFESALVDRLPDPYASDELLPGAELAAAKGLFRTP